MKNSFSKNDEAVSPVIGVILMVAITVILAAIIAGVVLPLAGSVKPQKTVAVGVSRTNSTSISATFNAIEPPGTTITALTGTGATINTTAPTCSSATLAVGVVCTWYSSSVQKVTLTATFGDGTSQVVMDTTV